MTETEIRVEANDVTSIFFVSFFHCQLRLDLNPQVQDLESFVLPFARDFTSTSFVILTHLGPML
jgi:hypothetical protein